MNTIISFLKSLEQFKVIFPCVNVEHNDNYWFYDDNNELLIKPITLYNVEDIEWEYSFEIKGSYVRHSGYFVVNVYDGCGGEFTMILNESKECKEEES